MLAKTLRVQRVDSYMTQYSDSNLYLALRSKTESNFAEPPCYPDHF